jgi:predicted transcriptional regulator of viral defense system
MKYEKEIQLYRIAEEQAGYFSLSQARELNLQRGQIYREVRRNKFDKAGWGVYRFAQFPPNSFEEVHVAVLSAGEKAIVGFQTALYIYDLSDIIPDEIHLILPKTSSRRRPGIRVHNVALEPGDVTRWEGFIITTVDRTIVDVARTHYDESQIELAIQQALYRGLTTKEKLAAQAARSTNNVQQLIHTCAAKVTL